MVDFYANRVHVNAANSGFGPLTLGDAISGAYQSFVTAGVPEGATFPYTIYTDSQFECGHGSYSSGTLVRPEASITAGSNGPGDLVDFSIPPRIFIGPLAEDYWGPEGAVGPLEELQISSLNPDAADNLNALAGLDVRVEYGDPKVSNTGFTNEVGIQSQIFAYNGQNTVDVGTTAKTTYAALALTANYWAAGQKFGYISTVNGYGMGDTFAHGELLTYAGGATSGDEGQGTKSIGWIKQLDSVPIATILSIPSTATINTTLTQAVTSSKDEQTVNVASSTGVTVGQWIVVSHDLPAGGIAMEGIKVTAVPSATSIRGVFKNNHLNGATVKPALRITVDNALYWGQQRVVVNRSGTTYNTGTVVSSSGAALTGSGTSWSATMVGGTAANVGAIQLDCDNCTVAPFDGSEGTSDGPMKSWYQIVSVTSPTVLAIHSFSTAADVSYRGRLATLGPSAYNIKPAARILAFADNSIGDVVLEPSAHTWSVGDTVECAVSPYPDVTGMYLNLASWTTGGSYRGGIRIINSGARKYDSAFSASSYGNTILHSTSDGVAFETGLELGSCNVGVAIRNAVGAGLHISTNIGGTPDEQRSGSIVSWGTGASLASTPRVQMEPDQVGMRWYPIGGETTRYFSFMNSTNWGIDQNSSQRQGINMMRWDGILNLHSTQGGKDPHISWHGVSINSTYYRIRGNNQETSLGVNEGVQFEKVVRSGTSADVVTPILAVGDDRVWARAIFDISEVTSPSNPAAGVTRLYAKDVSGSSRLAYRNSNSAEYVVLGGPAPTTVGSLPSASTLGAGARGFVTDASSTTFNSVVAGGGANAVPVFSDGTNWKIG